MFHLGICQPELVQKIESLIPDELADDLAALERDVRKLTNEAIKKIRVSSGENELNWANVYCTGIGLTLLGNGSGFITVYVRGARDAHWLPPLITRYLRGKGGYDIGVYLV